MPPTRKRAYVFKSFDWNRLLRYILGTLEDKVVPVIVNITLEEHLALRGIAFTSQV